MGQGENVGERLKIFLFVFAFLVLWGGLIVWYYANVDKAHCEYCGYDPTLEQCFKAICHNSYYW